VTTHDLFGLEREKLIKDSGVRNVFTPHTPVNSVDFFLGRSDEVSAIVAQINTPGQHSLLYGDRGVGKSSLANIATLLLYNRGFVKGQLYRRRCDSKTTFEHIVAAPLRDVGMDITIEKRIENHKEGGKASIGIPGFGAGVNSDRTNANEYQGSKGKISPSQACDALKTHQGMLVIDELDAVKDESERWRLSEFIKQLSDENSAFKVLAVGIASTAASLTAGHPSVQRCLKETRLDKMRDKELEQIVKRGAEELRLKFDDSVVKAIVNLSAGYPHFTHLLALKAAEETVATKRKHATDADLSQALVSAAKDAEGTLRTMYEEATVSQSTDMYIQIACAAASMKGHEFNADGLRAAITKRTGVAITQGTLNNYLQRLVSDADDTIFRRKAKGVYAFNDPRMASYIRIANRMVHH
jgi:hypothetical protein